MVSDDCSCGVVALLDSRRPSSEASKVSLSLPKSITDPHGSQQSILQATLTLAPKKSAAGSPKRTTIKQTVKEAKKSKEEIKVTGNSRFIVHNNQISEIQIANPVKKAESFSAGSIQDSKVLSRYSASTLLDIGIEAAQKLNKKKQVVKQDSDLSNGFKNNVTGTSTLPARHSKSLDQLKVSPQASVGPGQMGFSYTQPRPSKGPNQCPASYIPQKPTTLPRNLTISNLNNTRSGEFIPVFNTALQQRSGSQTAPINYNAHAHKGEEYRKNINEFREKYKNPCTRDMNFNNNGCRNVEYNKANNLVINNGAANNHTYPSYYVYNNQGNSSQHLENLVYNPLDFQRGYHAVSLPRPMLPPRNSYPPVSSKMQPCEPATLPSNKNIHRSNSTQVFYQKGGPDISASGSRNGRELTSADSYHSNIPYNHSYNDCGASCQSGSKYSSSNNVDSGIVINFREKSPVSSTNYSGKSPPSSSQGAPAQKQKKTKTKDSTKLHQSAKDLTRVTSSKDSLSSHQSSRSRESKTDRSAPRSDKRSASCGRHRPSEKMNQQISEASTSSSNESIPHALKRLESSSSVPFKLDQTQEGLRHCRSAASVLDESNTNSNIFSESLPNLAPPPAFDSPPLDITDKNFKILPPDTFKNLEDLKKRPESGSTSSLSEQSGWVSSGRSSERSSPDAVANVIKPIVPVNQSKPPQPKQNTDNLHTNTLQTKPPPQEKTPSEVKRTVLNGEQLRERLLKLAIKVAKSQRESLECCCDRAPLPTYDLCSCCNPPPLTSCSQASNGIPQFPVKSPNNQNAAPLNRSNGQQYQHSSQKPMLGVRHNSFNAVDLVNTKNGVFINGTIKDTPIVKTLVDSDGLHPYIRKELPQKVLMKGQNPQSVPQNFTLKERIEYTDKLLAAEIRSLTMDRICKETKQSRKNPSELNLSQREKGQKCRSEVDLSHIALSIPYDDLRLPPPQQFRDVPPPPDEFKVRFYLHFICYS